MKTIARLVGRVVGWWFPTVPPDLQARILAAMEGRALTPAPGVRGEAHPGAGSHIDQLTKSGDTVFGSRALPGSFWEKVTVDPEGCWSWSGATHNRGYGVFSVSGKKLYAHRLVYAALIAEIPPRVQVDHLCHNRRCVRPEHLRLATPKQNQENRHGADRGSSTGVRGVYVDRRSGSFYVQVGHNGAIHYGGCYADLAAAKAAAIALRNELFTHNAVDRGVGRA